MAGVAVTAITLCCALPSVSGSAEGRTRCKQIAAAAGRSSALSPGERKLDGQLAVTLRPEATRGRAEVDITVRTRRRRPRRRGCRSAGATVRHVASTGRSGRRPGGELRTVATWGAVERIEPAAQAMTARYRRPDADQAGTRGRSVAALATHVGGRPRARRGHRARDRRRSPASGRSCARCRDGVDSLAASQATGELPAVDVLPEHGGRRRRGHGDARDPPRHGARRRARLRDRVHQRRVASPTTSARCAPSRLRRDRRRRPLLQRVAVRGRADRAGGQRRHRRRRAVLQLGRQRGQHARRHLRQLRGRLPRLRPGVGKFAGEAHDFDPGTGGAGVRADLAPTPTTACR